MVGEDRAGHLRPPSLALSRIFSSARMGMQVRCRRDAMEILRRCEEDALGEFEGDARETCKALSSLKFRPSSSLEDEQRVGTDSGIS